LKHICKKTNCGKLIDKRGYCAEHVHLEIQQQRESWEAIKARQSKEDADFYNRSEWHKVSEYADCGEDHETLKWLLAVIEQRAAV